MNASARLIERLTTNIDGFRKLGDVVAETEDGPLIHIDNGADVLAVAHLDYVDFTRPKISGDVVKCPQLDDRLGVWTILDILPALGVKCDVLLTDSEERGRSTAAYFKTAKRYNWMFQFDRRGTDVVMYDYHSDENAALCEAAGFDVGWGSFSDICKLDSLGISGFNFGVGYHREHTRKCRADLKDTARQALKFYDFWRANGATRLEAPESRWDRLEREWEASKAARLAGGWSLTGDDWDAPGFFPMSERDDWFPGDDSDDAIDQYNARLYRPASQDEWECDCGAQNDILAEYCEECRMPVDYALRAFR